VRFLNSPIQLKDMKITEQKHRTGIITGKIEK
jgi:hypothetical protein